MIDNKALMSTETKNDEYGYGLAYRLAREQLAATADIAQQCLKSGAEYIESGRTISVEYLNQIYHVVLPDAEISVRDSQEAVPLRDKILILHYLTLAKGTPLTNKLIAYKELPGGATYSPTFSKRAIKPLVDYFGKEPHWLIDAAAKLGGHKVDYGDVAVTINAFSYVPITLVLWQGDEEFAPEGSIMFDSTISDYLTNDDIHTLCENIAWKLVRLLKTGGDSPGNR